MARRPRRFYVGTTLANAASAREVADRLEAAGWFCTYVWMSHGPATSLPGNRERNMARIAREEIRGVTSADAVLLLHPFHYGGHVELGAALVLAEQHLSRVYLYRPADADATGPNGHPCAFHYHPAVRRFDDLDTMIEAVLRDGEEGP